MKTAQKKVTPPQSNHELDLEMMSDTDAAATPPPDKLTKIIAAAADLREAELKHVRLEEEAKVAKKEAYRISTEVLPALMSEVQIKELGLENDDRLILEQEIYASISKVNIAPAIAWLDKNKYGSIAKSHLIVPLDRENPKMIAFIKLQLKSKKIPYVESGSIHPQTLKAFARESVEVGRVLPKAFSVHVVPIVTIKPPKKVPQRKSVVK